MGSGVSEPETLNPKPQSNAETQRRREEPNERREMRRRGRCFVRRALFLFCTALLPFAASGQFLQEPVRASVSVSETEVPAGSTFDVIADFEMVAGVHLYKDKISFRWEKLVGAKYVGNVFPEAIKMRDPLDPDPDGTAEGYEGSVRVLARFRSTGKEGDPIIISGELGFAGCTDEICYPTGKVLIKLDLTTIAALPREEAAPTEEEQQTEAAALAAKEEAEKPVPEKKRGAIWLILMAFAAGVGVSLTPCVYPMIPVTAAIIGGARQKGKLAALLSSLVYVLGLSITYSILGLLVASGGAKVRAALASPWVLVPIAGLFVLLALSMFEIISIQFQPKSVTKLQSVLSGKGHTLAIFALGIVSGLVVGPCVTAPLAGILVIVAKEASKLLGFFMLFALGWGMGLILIVAGTFTSALPKAGEWMVWVKKLLGFVLLWAAAYFLSSVIGSTAYRMATAVVLVAAAVFLGGFDTLTKESGFADRMKRFMGLLAVLVALYLVVGGLTKSQRPAPVSVFRQGSYEEVENAMASGQPVVLDFYTERCSACKRLDDETFSDSRVAKALEGFRALKVDAYKETQLEERFEVWRVGVPTVVFIGSDGNEFESLRFSGFKSADEFLEILKRVK